MSYTYKWRGESRYLPEHNIEVEHNQVFTTDEKVNHPHAEKVGASAPRKAKAKPAPKPEAVPSPSEPATAEEAS